MEQFFFEQIHYSTKAIDHKKVWCQGTTESSEVININYVIECICKNSCQNGPHFNCKVTFSVQIRGQEAGPKTWGKS